MPQTQTLQSVLVKVGLAFAPLRGLTDPARAAAFFRPLGYEIPPGAFAGALGGLSGQVDQLLSAVTALAVAGGDGAATAAILNTMARMAATITSVDQLQAQLQASGIPGIGEFKARLMDFLLLDGLGRQQPDLRAALNVLGLVEDNLAPPAGQPAYRIHWERLSQLMKEPGRIFRDVYHWDTGFDFEIFLNRLERLMRAASLPGGLYPQSSMASAALGSVTPDLPELRLPLFEQGVTPETYSQFGITFSPAEAQGGKPAGLALLPYLTGSPTFNFAVCDLGELVFESSADIRGIGIVIRPPASAEGVLNLTGGFRASLIIREKLALSAERILLGSQGGTRLSIQGLGVRFFAEGAREKLDLGVLGEAAALRLVIAGGEGDGFLQKILSGLHVEAETGFGVGMSLSNGFTFRGGSKFALELGTHLNVGGVKIDALRFALSPEDGSFSLQAGALLGFDLGPLQAVVQNIGLQAALRFQPGNLGPADLEVSFLPPNGVGLSLDAGGFTGGGYLLYDDKKGEYAGALELDFHGIVQVKAVGIINTKMPDGSPGFSLLILIAAEFTPIQLSFGFTLNGVGGLIGLNRTLMVSALAESLRTNAIKSVMFPENVVANITRIISDLRAFFPPQEGHFLIGPMMKIGWGTPSIVTLELGLLLDLPDPMFAIIGVLKVALPAEDAPLLRLQANFLGVMDFEHGYVFFRADLYDSRLLIYTITGSLAFLVSWGDQAVFAFSVGGFHPDFHDIPSIPALPDGFRNMARIGISLLSDDNPRLKVESYFAVTSNSVQFGSRVELYAEACGFNVYGFLGFDVLFQFDPFRFIARLEAGIALRAGTDVIAGIGISARLMGPTPWDARGDASLTLLFFEISVSFHVTWGDPPPAFSSGTEDLLKLLQGQLNDTRNWRADLPPNNHLHVTLKKIEPPAGQELLVIHPAGVVTFSQRTLPLENYQIQKYGTKKPLAEHQFQLSGANANGTPISADYQGVREQFAPANFSELSDQEKLSRHSFERLPSGFKLTATLDLLVAGLPVVRDVTYELSYLRQKRMEFKGLVKMALRAYNQLVKGSAARQSVLSHQKNRISLNAPAQVTLPPETFVIASTADLKPHGDGAPLAFLTQAEAYQRQRELIQQNPTLVGKIQVVSGYEVNGS